MTEKKPNILIVIPFKNQFIKDDTDILSNQYSLELNTYNWKKKYLVPIYMTLQLFSILSKIRRLKLIFIEFGGYWALIPSILGKIFKVPVVIILHGTDCASLPNISYGSLRKKLLKLSCKISYSLSTMLVPVSDSLIFAKNDYIDKDTYQGLKHHFPQLSTPTKVIYNGLDTEFWSPRSYASKKSNRFITVFSPSQFILKGGDLILALAQRYPECDFYFVGSDKAHNLDLDLSNVHFLGKLSREELREEYRKSEFHLQLSMFEGFGLSLCEAMLCECIPIGSSVNNIPDIIGNTGLILDKKDLNRLIETVEKGFKIKDKKKLASRARKRIIDRFKSEIREEKLLEIIKSVKS